MLGLIDAPPILCPPRSVGCNDQSRPPPERLEEMATDLACEAQLRTLSPKVASLKWFDPVAILVPHCRLPPRGSVSFDLQ